MPLSRRAIAILFPLLLLAATLLAYLPVLHAGFIWDDDAYVSQNPIYNMPDALHQIWFVPSASPQYYPIVFTTFYLERLCYGLNPLGYHLINVLLHAGSAILLWLVLKRLRVPGAMLAAAVFALHPMMVESVAWVTERKNTLSTFFFLASLLAFLEFALPEIAESTESHASSAPPALNQNSALRWVWYGLSLLLFIIALLSKSVACGLAPVLVLILWWQRAQVRGIIGYLMTIPYFILGAASGLFTAHLEKTQVGAQGDAWTLHFADKILLASQAIWFYIYKLLFPARLSFYYWRWPINPAIWWQWLFPAALIAAFTLLVLFRKRIGDWPLAAALMFVALLFPALGFFPLFPMLFSWVADHFAYLAALAFIPAVCAAITIAARRWIPLPGPRIALASVVLLLLAIKTNITTRNYLSLETLWSSILNYDLDHPQWNALSGMSGVKHEQAQAALNSGQRDLAMGLNEEARVFDDEALKVRPDYAISYNNIAAYYLFKGDTANALANIQKAIQLDPTDDRFFERLGDIYSKMQDWDKAMDAYHSAITMDKNRARYHVRMARALQDAGQSARAMQYLANALYLDPHNAPAHLLKGYILADHDDLANAIEEFREALRDDPSNAEAADGFAKAVAVSRTASPSDVSLAVNLAQRNVEASHGANVAYIDTFAQALGRAGRAGDAVELLQQILSGVPASDAADRQLLIRRLAVLDPQAVPNAPPTTRAAR